MLVGLVVLFIAELALMVLAIKLFDKVESRLEPDRVVLLVFILIPIIVGFSVGLGKIILGLF